MAIDAKVSFIDQMKEKLADVLTVEQMARLEKTGYELLDGFDMSETIQDDGPDDLLDSYVSAMQVECRSQKTIDRYVYIIGKLMAFAKVPTRRISVYHLRNFIATEKARGIQDTTLEGYREIFSAYFNWSFCKSLRGSDPNAALYYAMRLIEGGCNPMLVARRLVVHSAEDVGMADPRALQMATSAMYALEKIGYPEAMIPLSEAIIYVCEAEKSNSVVNAMYAAKADAREVRDDSIPSYLKDNSFFQLK